MTTRLETIGGLLDVIPDATVVVDADGRIMLANTLATQLFGYQQEDLLGQLIEVLLPDAGRDRHAALRAEFQTHPRQRPMGAGMDFTARRKNGSEFLAQISLGPLQPDNGKLVVACVRDTTERRRAEEAERKFQTVLLQRQKLESLGVLAGGIAHDFNNLLTAVVGNASLALLELPPESPARLSVEEIERAAQRATDLVRQMLAYSGRGHFVIQPLNLSDVVEEMAQILQAVISKKAVLRFEFFPNLPTINADATQMRQVIMNLITNAADAIGDRSGIITLRTGMVHADREYLLTTNLYDELAEGDYVYLEVSDTGSGMDESTKARIFDPFFSTKFVGRGLGLAAVQGIVRGHRGAIKIYSEVSRGTTFKVLLPPSNLDAVEPHLINSEHQDWPGSGTILVVDDEESGRALIRRILIKQGFEVVEAVDGRDALTVFKRHPADIRAVLLDLTMPHLGGAETLSELRRIRPDLRVILMSGYNGQEVTSQFSGKRISGFLQKPFTANQLLTILRQGLES